LTTKWQCSWKNKNNQEKLQLIGYSSS